MGTRNFRGGAVLSLLWGEMHNFKYLLVLCPHCLGTKKLSMLLCGPSETNHGPVRHTAGTAIVQNSGQGWTGGLGVRIQGPGPATPPPPPRVLNRALDAVAVLQKEKRGEGHSGPFVAASAPR